MSRKFLQVVNLLNSESDPRIDLAEILTNAFNQSILNIGGNPCELLYDGSDNMVKHRNTSDFDYNLHLAKIMCDQINALLIFADKHKDYDAFLSSYLFSVYDYFNVYKSEKENLEKLFRNLKLDDFFGDISGTFLKNKINNRLDQLNHGKGQAEN